VLIQLKKGRDAPATLACVRDDGTRTWGKEHPFFPVHDLTHCAVESVLGLDHRETFKPLTDAQVSRVRALRGTLEAQWHALPVGETLVVEFPAV
jgi:hypothetical protein